MSTEEEQVWGRIRRGWLKGALVGALVGAAIGLVLGAIVFGSAGAIVGAVVAGAVGLGGLGAFWGVLSGLETPDPGNEPSQAERPLSVSELTSEEHDRGEPPR
jgi:hypothetical protein